MQSKFKTFYFDYKSKIYVLKYLIKVLPCDLHFESNAIEDVCGVCHGDGTTCEFSGGTESFKETSKGIF